MSPEPDAVEAHLRRYGLRPDAEALPEVRAILAAEAEKERRSQGEGDTELMRLCCVQLFSAGLLEDVLPIWRAKQASFDAASAIEVQLLCGAGLEQTRAYLAGLGTAEAAAARARLTPQDFAGFTPEGWLRACADYFGVGT